MEFSKKQRDMLGVVRVRESIQAQLQGRGLTEVPALACVSSRAFRTWISSDYGDPMLSAADWEAMAVGDSQAGARSCGNHVCRSEARGRHGVLLFI